jgi:streptogramin lyase
LRGPWGTKIAVIREASRRVAAKSQPVITANQAQGTNMKLHISEKLYTDHLHDIHTENQLFEAFLRIVNRASLLLKRFRNKAATLVFAGRQLHFQLSCGLAALFFLAGGATAQGTPVKSFPIRGGSQPFAITMGEDGNFWFTLSNSNEVARITPPPQGRIDYFTTPTLSEPAFITPGPDGNIWFAEGSASRIASVTPDGIITEYQFSFFGVSVGITTGSDGNIWFTDQTDHAVWRFDLSRRRFTEFRTPTPNSFPGDITTGSDGNMWFTEQAVDKFARVTPNGLITEFSGVTAPGSIAAGPDGNLWVTSAFTSEIARVNPTTLAITTFPTPSTPTIIRPGNGNYLLFTEFSANKIASITIDGVVTESQEFPGSAPVGITAGVGSRVWFLGVGTNRVYETVAPH